MVYKIKKFGGNLTEYDNGKIVLTYLGSGKGASVAGYDKRTGVPLRVARGFNSKTVARLYLKRLKKRFS